MSIKINDKTNNISPLRYPGGKTRACKIIDDIIMRHFDISLFNTLSTVSIFSCSKVG